jgi:mono/diheme cytochrome c family protein
VGADLSRARRVGAAAVLAAVLAGLAVGPSAVAETRDPSELNYILHCAGCHQMDGSGAPLSGVPDARGVLRRLAQDADGRAYLVRVPGAAQSPLSDAELAAVLNFMVERLGEPGGPRAAGFTATEVASVRGQPLADAAALRERLLARPAR